MNNKCNNNNKRRSRAMQPWHNRIVGYGEEAPDQLLANPRNFRVHPRHQQEALSGVLREVGVVQNIIVNKRTGLLIDGHLRVTLALRDDQPMVPVTYVDLSESEEAVVLATLDPIAALATTDAQKLDELLREVSTGEAAVSQLLADMAEAAGIVPDAHALPKRAGGDEFDTTPDDGPTRCTLGDLWLIGGKHRLIIGDSTDGDVVARLMEGARANAVVTDPPYGQNQPGVTNDEPEKLEGIIKGVLKILPVDNAAIVVFQSPRTFPTWLDAARQIGHKFERMLWLYKVAQNTYPWRGWLLTSEAIVVTSVGSAHWTDEHPYSHDCYSLSEVSRQLPEGSGWHGSIKPIDVVLDIVKRICPSGTITLDPFLGSGTTLIAAHRTNRICYGVEIDPRYGDVILRRAEAEGLTVERVESWPTSHHN